VLFRREVLETTKGFDPLYFMYGEDLDLGIRTFLLGWDVLYSPDATIYHKYQYRESASKFFFLERNRLLTMLKVYRVRTILFLFPLLLASETAAIVRASRDRWLGEKLRGYGSVLAHVKYLSSARKEVQLTRARSDNDLISLLKGAMKFEPLTKSSTIAIGNIILEKYRSFLLGLRL
jgi:GT2 family glycosyltransferase